MGYGFGGFLVVAGPVLARTAFTYNRNPGAHSLTTTTHGDGSQTVSERRTEL